MCVSQFLGKMFTPLASVQVPSQNNIFYSLFTFTLVLERNSSLIIISQVYVCLYALVYVCVCVAIFGTFVHTPWTCYSASLKDEKRCVCLNFWAKCSRPWQVSKSQVKIIYF